MSDGFSLDDLKESAENAAESVREQSKTLVPWLPDPHTCDNCGAYCDADYQYVAGQAAYLQVWQCPECGSRYFRERV